MVRRSAGLWSLVRALRALVLLAVIVSDACKQFHGVLAQAPECCKQKWCYVFALLSVGSQSIFRDFRIASIFSVLAIIIR